MRALSFPILLLNSLFHVSSSDGTGSNNRIVGGTIVEVNTYPWFTRLFDLYCNDDRVTYELNCGGSLISSEWVLTAAHCNDYISVEYGSVTIGAFTSFSSGNGGQYFEEYYLDDIVVHPNYDPVEQDNNFALLKLYGSTDITPVDIDNSNLSDSYAPGELREWNQSNIQNSAKSQSFYVQAVQGSS